MPKITTPLTDTEIKKSKSTDKQYKLSDGAGLCLIVPIKGKKYFRFDYSINGKRKSISFGTYPETSLKEARDRRAEAKELIKDGIDPAQQRKIEKNIETFEMVSAKWLELAKGDWEDVTYKKAYETLKNNTLIIKDKEMKKITRLDILKIIEVMQKREVHVLADRILGYFDRIWKYAVTYNICEHNIIADIDRRNALKQTAKKHFPAITNEKDIKILMNDIKEYKNYKASDISTIYAFLLAPYIFLRPVNLRTLEWLEIDFKKGYIEIPAEKMKTRKSFIIPMSNQVIKILNDIKPYSQHISQYVFPSPSDAKRPISENTLNMVLKRMGYKDKMVPHGFRSMFSTIAHEKINEHGHHSDVIELCLAHEEKNKVKGAYNRESKMKHYEERKELLQWYCDWLDEI
jgi:integrase